MIIFSVQKENLSAGDNMLRVEQTIHKLEGLGIQYRVLDGMYDGQKELSFIMRNKSIGKCLEEFYAQDNYLERGHRGFWYLINVETDRVVDYYRTIKEVSKETALNNESYSVLDNKYYIGV